MIERKPEFRCFGGLKPCRGSSYPKTVALGGKILNELIL